jgi:hypothetical protein
MSRLLGLAFLVLASAAAAEPVNGSEFQLPAETIAEPPDPLSFKRGFQIPRVDYVGPSGSAERKHGIVAGVELSPNAVIGIGLFDRKRRTTRLLNDQQLDKPRRGKKIAVGVTLRF